MDPLVKIKKELNSLNKIIINDNTYNRDIKKMNIDFKTIITTIDIDKSKWIRK